MSSEVSRVDKPWGYEIIWAKTDRYIGKVLHIEAGHALSLQYHEVKEETIRLNTGKLILEVEEPGQPRQKIHMSPGDSYHLPPHTIHRMIAEETRGDSGGARDVPSSPDKTRPPDSPQPPDQPFQATDEDVPF